MIDVTMIHGLRPLSDTCLNGLKLTFAAFYRVVGLLSGMYRGGCRLSVTFDVLSRYQLTSEFIVVVNRPAIARMLSVPRTLLGRSIRSPQITRQRLFSARTSTTSQRGTGYCIPASSFETSRLDVQHSLSLQSSGGLLYPPWLPWSSFSSILDYCTGSTVWARHILAGGGGSLTDQRVELAPGSTVDVCDLGDGNVPKPLSTGINEFFRYNILNPFPEDRRGRCLSRLTRLSLSH